MSEVTMERPQPSASYRWAVLILISLAMFGNYYIYDSINPVTDLMKEQLQITDQEIGRLNSVYSLAAVIVLLIGGVMIDRLGTKLSTFIFAALCLAASIMTVATDDIRVIFASRFVLGLGAEPLIVAVTTALAKWFKGKQLGFAFGINLAIARLASMAADNSPTWAKGFASFEGWKEPLSIGIAAGVIGVVGAIGYWILEARAERRYTLGHAGEMDKLVVGDLFRFTTSYWWVVMLCLTFYSAIFPFRTFAVKFMIEGHGASRELAGALNSAIPFAAIVATPLFGILVDYIGKRATLMIYGSLLLLPGYLLLLPNLQIPLAIPMVLIGIAFSLVPAIMWPSVAYIVEQGRLGSAYALMTLVQQLGVMALNEVLGKSNDVFGASASNPNGYSPMLYILAALGLLGMFFGMLLKRGETGPGSHGLETITARG